MSPINSSLLNICASFTSIDDLLLIIGYKMKDEVLDSRSHCVGTQTQFTLQQIHWQLYCNTVCQWSLGYPVQSETFKICDHVFV